MSFFFDEKSLFGLADRLSTSYGSATPFPHVIIDDFLEDWVLDEVLREFPTPDEISWRRYKTPTESKLASKWGHQLGPFTRHVLSQFNSSAMCDFLEKLTGIGGIIPDPYFVGGGLHQIESGGFLKVHVDFNRHKRLRLDRRLNLLLYLNRDWQDEYGGNLEIWDKDMRVLCHSVRPDFNRCVIFNTTSTSYHGHPRPLTSPKGVTRKSMALYYYTSGMPEVYGRHSTLFKEVPS